MPKIIRVHDPDEVERRVQFLIKGADYPGLLQVLGSVPHGAESALIRSVLYQWFVIQQEEGTLERTIETFLAELTSKKKTGGLKAGLPSSANRNRLADGANAVGQSRISSDNTTHHPGGTDATVPYQQLIAGVGTDQRIGATITLCADYPVKISESSVDGGEGEVDVDVDVDVDESMLADIGSFLG